MPKVNPWMYAKTILRVEDVYGRRHWIDKKRYDDPDKVMIPICLNDGLFRRYSQAGGDNQNVLHRGNIAKVIKEKVIE